MTLAGRKFVILEQAEYLRLRRLAGTRTIGAPAMPPLPKPDADGNYPAVEYARASLARDIIHRRWAIGLSQAELARRAGIRPETLNRIERARASADIGTVEKIVRALEKAESSGAGAVG